MIPVSWQLATVGKVMTVSTIISGCLKSQVGNSLVACSISLWLVLMTSCAGARVSSTATLSVPSSTVEVILPEDGRDLTAKESYPPAQAEAIAWHHDAILYAIMPSYVMAENLAADFGDKPGWVFKFGRPEGRMEFFVHVARGEIRSLLQAHPVYFEPPPKSLPIDMEDMNLDSPQVLEAFLRHGGDDYLAQHPSPRLDYQLMHPPAIPNPVWSLFDYPNEDAVFHVDAVTGQPVCDPSN